MVVCVFIDKLTGVMPVLSPGVRGVPLPKVAAHVTGVISSAEPPAADGEALLMRHRHKISSMWNQLTFGMKSWKGLLTN